MATDTQPKTPGKLQQLMAMAQAAQKQREKAPMTGVVGDLRIPQKDIISRFTQDQGGQNDAKDGFHYLFIDNRQLKTYAARGYEPVVEDGEVVPYQTDVLIRIPTKFYEDELGANKARSDHAMTSEVEKMTKGTKVGKATVSRAQTGPDANRAAQDGGAG